MNFINHQSQQTMNNPAQNTVQRMTQSRTPSPNDIKVTINILDSAKNPTFRRERINRIYNILKPHELNNSTM